MPCSDFVEKQTKINLPLDLATVPPQCLTDPHFSFLSDAWHCLVQPEPMLDQWLTEQFLLHRTEHKRTFPGFEHCMTATSDSGGVGARPAQLLSVRREQDNTKWYKKVLLSRTQPKVNPCCVAWNRQNQIKWTVVHFHPCYPAVYLQTIASVLLYKIFLSNYVVYLVIFGDIYNMQIRNSKAKFCYSARQCPFALIKLFRPQNKTLNEFPFPLQYLQYNSMCVHSLHILQNNKLCSWNIHFHLKCLLRLEKKKTKSVEWFHTYSDLQSKLSEETAPLTAVLTKPRLNSSLTKIIPISSQL